MINSRAHLLAVSPLTDSSDLSNKRNTVFNQSHNPSSALKWDLFLNKLLLSILNMFRQLIVEAYK